MSKSSVSSAATAFVFFFISAAAAFGGEVVLHTSLKNELCGSVVSVADGDTITVMDSENHPHKIRLSGIDAPEKGQDFSDVSKRRLSDLVGGKEVLVEQGSKDRYGRTVGRVFVLVDVCELMVCEGLAFHYLQYAPKDTALADAESFARAHHYGVWALENGGIRPWDFRRNRRAKK